MPTPGSWPVRPAPRSCRSSLAPSRVPSRRRTTRPGRARARAAGTIGPMSVPGRQEAASLLLSLDPPIWAVRHARAVAEVAAWLARAVAARGSCDRRAAETAGLLHDVDKRLPESDPDRRLGHGRGSASWLARGGHPELGPLVAEHPVTRLLLDDWQRWLAEAPIEALIVAYADKRGGQRLEPMAARFADWARRYADDDGWSAEQRARAWSRALALETRVCDAAACQPSDVRRLRWTEAALAAAAREARAA
jgi:predicted hydrolase (HD superfamily)